MDSASNQSIDFNRFLDFVANRIATQHLRLQYHYRPVDLINWRNAVEVEIVRLLDEFVNSIQVSDDNTDDADDDEDQFDDDDEDQDQVDDLENIILDEIEFEHFLDSIN